MTTAVFTQDPEKLSPSKYQTRIHLRFGCGHLLEDSKFKELSKKNAIFTSKPGARRLLKQMQYAQCALLTLCLLGNLFIFCFSLAADFFQNQLFFKNLLKNTYVVSNSLESGSA